MKQIILAVLLFLVSACSVNAQEKVYLPIVSGGGCKVAECNRTWRIVKPDGMTNFALNPSAETTGNFTAEGGTTVTRVTTFSHYGLYSYRVQTNNDDEGIEITLSSLSNAAHFVTMRVRGKLPPVWDWSLDDSTYLRPELLETLDAEWTLYGARFPASQANGSTKLSIHQNGNGDGDFYLDGIQVEDNTYWTMYCDGTQPGCEWNGTADASTSTRSAVSRAGGIVQDLWSEYGFFAEEIIGAGAAVQSLNVRSFATLPGGELSGSKIEPREFTIIGRFIGESEADLHAKRQELLEELSLDTYPASQPVLVNFTGAIVQKQISVIYQGGLEARLNVSIGKFQVESDDEWRILSRWTEKVSIQFLAPNPFWLEIGESSELLDTNDSVTFNAIAGRLRSTGQWDNLNVGSAPAVSNLVRVIIEGPDKKIYIGGYFEDWNGVANRNFIAAYDPSTDSWETVGGVGDVNDNIEDMAFGPDGTLYIVGAFTNVDGVGAADYIAQWSGSAWSAVGTPNVGAAAFVDIDAIAFDTDGNLYVGGNFTNLANVANADYFAMWDGSSWTAVGSGGTAWVDAIAIDSKNNIYIGGSFANWAGVAAADLLAVWDGSSWAALNNWSFSGGFQIYDMLVDESDLLYVGGDVEGMGGVDDADYVAAYNGTSFFALGESVDDNVLTMDYYNGSLYVAGSFGSLRFPVSIDLPARVAKWNGASWSFLDAAFPLTANHYFALAVVNPDPVVQQNVNIYVGTRDPGSSDIAGSTTVANSGTTEVYPVVKFTRSGGTSARIFTVRNETTGKELLMYYALQDGETLTIDLSPTGKSIISSFYGSRLETILANSDFGSFSLIPDDNNVTSFVNVAGGPTIIAWMLFKDTYKSFD